MSKEKNLKAKLSFLIFIVSICSFAMLQGFELKRDFEPVYITVTGGSNSGCKVTVTDTKDRDRTYLLRETSEAGVYVLTGVNVTPGPHYTMRACNPIHGDSGIEPNVELIKGVDGKKKNILNILSGQCAE